MKFGKYLEARQLELPEYNGHFIDYKALKKLIKHLAVPLAQTSSNDHLNLDDVDEEIIHQRLQENKASFFFKLERELEKVNSHFLEKESDLKTIYDILQSKFVSYRDRGQLSSKKSVSYGNIHSGLKKFQRDLGNLEQYIELNRTGFAKVLKKWDKRSHSHQKEFYLATVVSVQPIFTSNEVSKLNDLTSALLVQLDDISKDDTLGYFAPEMTRNNSHTPNKFARSPSTRSSSQQNLLAPKLEAALDIDLEIEKWYMEIVNISKLKDDHRKFSLIKEFYLTKIKSAIDDAIPSSRIDKSVILNDYLTRLFLLLVGNSAVDDVSLHVFYTSTRNNVDLSYCDENDQVFSRRNVFHEAANCASQSRIFILREALIMTTTANPGNYSFLTKESLKNLLNAQDLYLRTPLHYAAELGKLEFVKLLISSGLLDSVDILDNHSHTPLVLAIKRNHIEVVRELLVNGNAAAFPQSDELSKPQFAPLIIACYHNNYQAADLILQQDTTNVSDVYDAEGLGTLHIVAKEGGDAQLIDLLVQHGADPNGVDNFNAWTPIFYAVQEGHAETVRELSKHGARLDITDENGLGPLYYAIWETHVDVINVIRENLSTMRDIDQKKINPIIMSRSMSPSNSLQDIPDFALPPPIIPLRKYGHNFLEKKIFVKLVMKHGNASIQLQKDDEMILSCPGRITLTSNLADIVPRNIILPIADEEERDVVFQIDSLEAFSIDFEVFPASGTRMIAKTTAMPTTFNSKLINGMSSISLPLFDSRLTNVGTLSFDYQVIMPYIGRSLEVTKYEPYWKSTIGADVDLSKDGHQIITSSSLSGSFVSVLVRPLKDGTLVVASLPYVTVNNVKLFLNDLTREQIEQLTSHQICEIPTINDEESLKRILASTILAFDSLLNAIPLWIQLDIQVCFPTTLEMDAVPVNISPFLDINQFIDQILLSTFEHVRKLRHSGQAMRPVVFSSCNWQACTILNWKQPSFPVLLIMNDLRMVDGLFIRDTPHNLKDLAVDQSKITFSDERSKCLHEIVSFVANNNLLGIIFPYDILMICRPLINAIRGHGLLLIGSCSDTDSVTLNDNSINGIHRGSELNFTRSVEM